MSAYLTESTDFFGIILNSILAIVSIVIFSVSIYKSKLCLESATPQNYNSAKGMNTASIVFFVLCCIRFLYNAIVLLALITVLIAADSGLLSDIFAEGTFILILSAISVAAFILGIVALSKFSKAKTLYFRTHPMPAPNYYRGNQYPYQNQYPQNGAFPNQNPYQNQYPYQQNYTYQNPNPYGQGNPYQNPYAPQNNAPQAPISDRQGLPYEAPPGNTPTAVIPVVSDPQPASGTAQGDNDVSAIDGASNNTVSPSAVSDSKLCPHCGVTNASQNKFCTFCGKELQ